MLKNLVQKNQNYEFEFSALKKNFSEKNFSDFSLLIFDQIVTDTAFFNSLNLPIISFIKEQKDLDKIHFLPKPVHITELFAEIKNILQNQRRKILNLGDFIINFESRFIQKDLNETKLTELEAKILQFFLEKSAEEKTKNKILQEVWNHMNSSQMTDTGIVEVTINKLRKKLKEIGIDEMINFKMA